MLVNIKQYCGVIEMKTQRGLDKTRIHYNSQQR